jgi:threonine dehydrogenase-like Zn-dependent dehydrogenase
MVCDLLRVPFADHMLVPLPRGIDPVKVASASDNIPDAYRTVAPGLAKDPGAPTLVVGGSARSIGLYAVAIAIALGSSHVDYVDDATDRLTLAEKLGANAIHRSKHASWYRNGKPTLAGGYLISVDASNSTSGLQYALRALAPGGTCTSVGFYFRRGTPIPLWQMYLNDSRLHAGLSHPRADLPAVLELIASGTFDPGHITTTVAPWNDAAEAFLCPGTKVVVTRPKLT